MCRSPSGSPHLRTAPCAYCRRCRESFAGLGRYAHVLKLRGQAHSKSRFPSDPPRSTPPPPPLKTLFCSTSNLQVVHEDAAFGGALLIMETLAERPPVWWSAFDPACALAALWRMDKAELRGVHHIRRCCFGQMTWLHRCACQLCSGPHEHPAQLPHTQLLSDPQSQDSGDGHTNQAHNYS